MMYTVIRDFSDSTDKKWIYRVGDKFPRPGISVSEDRIKGLLGTDNKQGRPLIKEDAKTPKEDVLNSETGVRAHDEPEAKRRPRKGQRKNA